jgi:hypothetical protein
MIIAAVVNDSFMVDFIFDDDFHTDENLWQQLLHFFCNCNETKVQAHKAQMKHVESSLSVRNFRGNGLRVGERLPCVAFEHVLK